MNRPERVLVKVPNWLGDLVSIHPALRALRRTLSGSDDRERQSRLSVMVPERLAGFYRATRWIDDVVTHPWPVSWRARRHLAAAAAIRAHRPDRLLIVPGSFETALWPWLARAPQRVGAPGEGRSLLLTSRVAGPDAGEALHTAEHLRRLLSSLAGVELAVEPTPPDIDPDAAERVAEWLSAHRHAPQRPLVVLAPSSARAAKRWPARCWAELADALSEREVEVLLVVAPWERGLADEVATRAHARPLVSSELDVASLMALAARADGWIGNDSGPSHVAAALGTPTATVFVSSDPARCAPRGPSVVAVGPTGSPAGPASEEVLDAWGRLER